MMSGALGSAPDWTAFEPTILYKYGQIAQLAGRRRGCACSGGGALPLRLRP
jgi:hypothetical protein